MFLFLELIFIALLAIVFFMLYRKELLFKKSRRTRAVAEEYWNGRERRRHVRFKKVLEMEYAVIKKPHLKNSTRTVDISEGGVKLLADEKFGIGALLALKITVPASSAQVELEGEVVWSEEAVGKDDHGKRLFHSGVKFSSIREPDGAHLMDYIRSLSSDG